MSFAYKKNVYQDNHDIGEKYYKEDTDKNTDVSIFCLVFFTDVMVILTVHIFLIGKTHFRFRAKKVDITISKLIQRVLVYFPENARKIRTFL